MIKSNDALCGVSEAAKQTKNFLSSFFALQAEGWGEEPCKENARKFLGLPARVRERVRGAHHSSSGFNSKYIRTLFNIHRQKETSHALRACD